MIPLQLLQIGEPAVVEEVDGPDASIHRLHEMGLQPGVEVEMLQEGSPCIVRIGEQRLCLRFDDATTILVTTSPHARPTV